MEHVDLGICAGSLFTADPDRTAIVLPGANYNPAAPLLWFSTRVALDHGWSVLQVWDQYDPATGPMTWVTDRFNAALDAASGSEVMVIAKSLTTRAVSFAADRGLAGIWITPLMGVPEVIDGLQRSTAPTLAIGGSRDPSWDRAAAHLAGIEVSEVHGGDHSLGTDDARLSLGMLMMVIERIDMFFQGLER